MPNSEERVGVFICECGPNIKEAMNIEKLVSFTRNINNVVLSKRFGLLCSEDGKELISKDIDEYNLTKIIVAGCSPKEHENTFRDVLKKSGLNPFFLQIANIREQCAWVTENKEDATLKAERAVSAAVNRIIHHDPLVSEEIECKADVLVIGAGVAGMSAALSLAQKNRKIYLVEKLPYIGGKVALYEDLFPSLECATCILDPNIDEILNNEHIEVLTHSEVQQVLGYFGNFVVNVMKKASFVDAETCVGCEACFENCPVTVSNEYNEYLNERKAIYLPYAGAMPNVATIDNEHCLRWKGQECDACEIACPFGSIAYDDSDKIRELQVGAIVVATGFDLFDPTRAPRYGYGKIENVITSLEFERLMNSTGPTGGKIQLKNGFPPRKIAFIHCVGSRTEHFNSHCSGICCTYLLKFAHQTVQNLPDVSIVDLYSDLCLPGKESQGFYDTVSQNKNVEFIRMKEPDSLEIIERNGKPNITYTNINGEESCVSCDMVVLAPAIEGTREISNLAEILEINRGKAGFFVEENAQIDPVSSSLEGIFIAGCCQGPKDIQGSVAQGQAAAGKILSRLVIGEKLPIEEMVAEIDGNLCSSCNVCTSLCPYKAIDDDKGGTGAKVNALLCKGCGICSASCPSGAIKARHFTDTQVSAEIKGALKIT